VSEENRGPVIRRILVALDASPHSEAALEAAAALAARFQAELYGLFVEDVNLLRLAELPFTREVGIFSATQRELRTEEVERHLRIQAREVRRTLTVVAEREQVRWSFRVSRGAIAPELRAAAEEVDLLILGKAGRSVTRRGQLGSTARALSLEAPSLTLLLQEGACLGLPVMVVYDGSPLARKALSMGAVLAEEEGGPVTVIVADGVEEVQRIQDEAAAQLREEEVKARYRTLTRSSVSRLAHMVHIEGCGLLVLPAKSDILEDEALLALLDEMEVPVLLVR
jgi:nucleotide-binding universal stress UspA family protein